MSSNEITGDKLISRALSKQGEDNFDRIFGVKCAACGKVIRIDDIHTCSPQDYVGLDYPNIPGFTK